MIVVGTNLTAIIFAVAGFAAVDAEKKQVLERKFLSYCALEPAEHIPATMQYRDQIMGG